MPESDPIPPELHGLDPGELLARGMNTVRPSGGRHDWTPATPEELSRMLPQYRIESLLGRGGMGAVYKGFQSRLNRPVAIKLLPAELTADAEFVRRFEREARTLAKLQHPGIVAIHDFGQTGDGHLYFVMEYVEGTDLRRILQGPGLSSEQALEIIVQVCEALQAAHRQGVIHRDIKPANILMTTEGRVKLADFGLARPDLEENEGLTLSNVVLGTPDYMAPEQHSGEPDHRADIFALGLMLYEMLTGQLPRGAFVPPSRKVQVDVRIDEVVIKALQEEPDLRYQQASEMKTDVDQIRSSVAAPPPIVPPTSRVSGARRTFLATMAIGAGLMAMVLLLGKKHSAPSKEPSPEPAVLAASAPVEAARPVVAATPVPSPVEKLEPSAAPDAPRLSDAKPDAVPGAASSPQMAESPLPLPTAPPVPSSLGDVLFDYDWQYQTSRPATSSRPSFSFVHGLFFERDGTIYSRGKKSSWKWTWHVTGPRSVHIEQGSRGFTADITFNESFSTFSGNSTDGSTLTGWRAKRFSPEDMLQVRQQLSEKFGTENPPEKKETKAGNGGPASSPVERSSPR